MWYVYFIKSNKKEWYYVGSTNRIDERLIEHNNGKVKSTKAYRPFTIVYTEKFESMHDARSREKLIKDKRIEKERIIKKYCRIV